MLYRRSTKLALETVLLLAAQPQGTCLRVRELAAQLDVPATYLAKIVQNLTRVGLLHAVRGPRGGVRLADSSQRMCLWEVLSALEPASELERCLLRLDECSDAQPCPLHEAWAPIRNQIVALLESQNLMEFASEARQKGTLVRLPAPAADSKGSAHWGRAR